MAIGIPCALKIRICRLAKQNGMSARELVEWGLRLYLDALENGGALKTGCKDAMTAAGHGREKRCRPAPCLSCRTTGKRVLYGKDAQATPRR